MKKILFGFLGLILFAIVGATLVLGFLGYIPGLSKALGVEKPKDLGVRYTEKDRESAREKSKLEYAALPEATPASQSFQLSGSQEVETSWSQEEMTALLNDRPWKYWAIEEVQLKINDDGTAELSGIVDREKLKGYAQAIGVSSQVIDTGYRLFPKRAAFYVKFEASLENNQVAKFDIQSASLGKMPLPANTLLSNLNVRLIEPIYAQNLAGELSKYEGKREAIVNFINQKINGISCFNADAAYFENSKLFFDGTLCQKEATAR